MPASFIASYVEYAKAHTSAPEKYHQFAGLSICAAALGNRVWIEGGFGRCYPSLWIALMGPTGVHKSSASGRAAGILGGANSDLLLPQGFSWEALLLYLRDNEHGGQPAPYGLLYWAEMGRAIEAFSVNYAGGVFSFLTDIWDSGPIVSRVTKADKLVEINYPALSILAAGTPAWLKKYIKPHQVSGGFMGRWLFVWGARNEGYLSIAGTNNSDADRIQREGLVEHLKRLSEYEGGEMAFGEGLAPLDAWLEKNEGRWSEDEDPAGFSNRAGVNVLKLAMAIQASQGVHFLRELHPTAVEQAIELWGYSFDSGRALMREVIGHSVDSEALEKIERVIRGAGRIRQRDVLRALHMKERTFKEYTDTLIASGKITAEGDDSQPGGRVIWYEWVG